MIVHGEGRKYVTALISLDPDDIAGWAKEQGIDATGEQLNNCPGGARAAGGLHRAGQPSAGALGDDQELHRPADRADHRGGRGDSQHEDSAQAVEAKYRDLLDRMYAGD